MTKRFFAALANFVVVFIIWCKCNVMTSIYLQKVFIGRFVF